MASTASTLAAEPAAELAAPLSGLATGLTAAALCARWRTMKAPEVPHKGGDTVYCLDVPHTVWLHAYRIPCGCPTWRLSCRIPQDVVGFYSDHAGVAHRCFSNFYWHKVH